MAFPIRRGLTSTSRHIFSLFSQSRFFVSRSQSQSLFPSTTTTITSHHQQHQHKNQRCQHHQQHLSHQKRPYHSDHHPTKQPHETEYTNSQTTILSAALAHVPRHGFSHAALTLGARNAGFLDVSVQLLPRGEFDLVLFWLASRRGLLRAVAAEKLKSSEMSVGEKIRVLILERLRMNEGVRGEWQGALALMSLASNIPLSLSELHALSSDILNLAGDTSVDASWYTKRLSVAAVYASADVFMTRDESPGFVETEEFVHRRFEDTETLGEKVGGVKQCLGFMGSTAAGLGRSWGLKI